MAKIAIFLVCLVMLVVVEQSLARRERGNGRGRGRGGADPCKTDNTCGDNPVTESLDGTEYCCSEGSRIKLKPPREPMTEARCKCIGARGGPNRRRGRPLRCKPENSCGEGAVTDTANGRPVCCPAGHVVNKVSNERNGRTRERCHCQATEAEASP